LYNFAGTLNELKNASSLDMEVYYVITGIICESNSDRAERLRDHLQQKKIDVSRLLLASDSPFNTPQNIADAWVRERHNEPSNMPYILEIVAKCLGITTTELATTVRQNTKKFFNLMDKNEYEAFKASKLEVKKEKEEQADASDDEEKSDNEEEEEVDALEEETANSSIQEKEVTKPKNTKTKEKESKIEEDETPVVEEEQVRYACKKCRKILFQADDIIPHSFDAPTISKKNRKKGQNIAERNSELCRMLFIKKQDWFNLTQDDEESSDEDMEEYSFSEGKLKCNCKFKLGKWSTIQPLECSCGQSVQAKAYMVLKKTVDMVTSLGSENFIEAEEDEGESIGVKKKKKKSKSKQKRDNNANFTSFRNKSYNVKTKKKSTEEQDETNEPVNSGSDEISCATKILELLVQKRSA